MVECAPVLLLLVALLAGGKTSCAFNFRCQLPKQVENSCVVYIKSEGRLSNRILNTAGVDQSPNKWILYPGNIYEEVGALVKKCIDDNPDNLRFMFIIDSMDALIRRDDTDKALDEADKVAGNALDFYIL